MAEYVIEARDVSKIFIGKRYVIALRSVDLEVKEGESFILLGPSGCGKTTFLRIVAGLEKPTQGEVLLDGEPIKGPGKDRGMVFQEFALFPWRKVISNVEFGLELQGMPKDERRKIAEKYIRLVGLTGFENAWIHELSAGMRQRAGLARVLANDPRVLLMDEPFGAIDVQTRNVLQDELLRIHKGTNKTVLFVTHSVEEAIYLGDRIAIFSARPGTVKEVVNVHDWLSTRRNKLSEEFLELKKYITRILTTEVSKTIFREALRGC